MTYGMGDLVGTIILFSVYFRVQLLVSELLNRLKYGLIFFILLEGWSERLELK